MDYERENAKLRACLREIYRSFQYGPGASSPQAPFIMKMVEEALGWERQPVTGGSGGTSTAFGGGGGGLTYAPGVGFCGGGGAGSGQAFSIPADASEVYISRRGGGLPPIDATVKIERKD